MLPMNFRKLANKSNIFVFWFEKAEFEAEKRKKQEFLYHEAHEGTRRFKIELII